ncbi:MULTISPECIES: glycosyltransferase family 39 protein [unclassified Pseudomonas]|uniref:ArnT family glycosyltransferase n=1 Tax=unclassified Pseudomonas TaxID=196821 RepID=UPI002AC9B5DC|nr:MULTISPECIES: glycosyltransferase family 39 protein [unclassified Pseudomonas]MEB0039912.1 glycosyltransferase family 39 protein [Pseudomonas sp. MH10]MEB0077147.1 glycosyltransferase family 39 protein [Pseudomonas sp. MH10out]MEB0093054.1 glycosyltransferase family 39 protein [Pseudomonas sp. CCI4.2]MEB0102258.1 glycosyltransferase family 39 protein [Pseudomonas sp. CCI3.2]MEB0123526.1 glycosyltransferase family 39 protein [Pseudomonas sp. CCI1.2]
MSTRPVFLLFVLGCLLFFVGLGNHQLQGSTEPRVAGIAMEMHLDNDWVTPKLNGQPFLEKPPLSLWLDAGAIRVFGANTWSVRLASALAGLLSMLTLYGALRKLGRPVMIAVAAAVFLATTASYWSNVRQVGEDSLLSLGVTLALLGFFLASQHWVLQRRRSVGLWSMFALGIVIATLSKGVLGLALPGAVIFAFLIAQSLIEKRFVLADWVWPAALTLVALLPLAVWLGFLYQAGGGSAINEVLWANSVGRFSGGFSEAGHFEPFYYYLAKLPQAFLPWNILVYVGLWHFCKKLRASPYLLFFSLWLLAQLTLLTLASSKRMVYLMSMTPAAAVIAAEYGALLLERLRERSATSVWAQRLVRHQRASIFGVVGLFVISYLAVAIWVIPREDRQQAFTPLTEQIRALQQNGQRVVLFTPSERLAGAGVFYTQSLLVALQSEEQLNSFLSESPTNVAVMERQTDPVAPLKVLKKIIVGDRAYYFMEM